MKRKKVAKLETATAAETTTQAATRIILTDGQTIEHEGESFLLVNTGKSQFLFTEYEQRIAKKRLADFFTSVKEAEKKLFTGK